MVVPHPVGRDGERGFAVVISLVALLLVSVALALLATSMRLEMEEATRSASRMRLTALSDSALALTLARLAASDGVYGGLREEAFGDGFMTSRIQRLSGGRMRIVLTVRYRGRRRSTEAFVRLTDGTLRVLRWRRLPGAGGWRTTL